MPNQPTIDSLQIESKLAVLRKEWLKATQSRRQTILLQARCLKLAQAKILQREGQQSQPIPAPVEQVETPKQPEFNFK